MAARLFDAEGNEIIVQDGKPVTEEVGVVTNRDNWDTYPSHGLTPPKLAAILREADQGDVLRQMELYQELEEKDGLLESHFGTRKLAVAGLEWEIEPGCERGKEPTPEEEEISRYVDQVLRGIENWDDFVMGLLDAIGKGYSITEIFWEQSESDVSITKTEWRDQRKFIWNDTFTELRLVSDADPNGIDINSYNHRFLYHRYAARQGKPTRAGLLRTCTWMFLFKRYGWKDWLRFAEAYGMPLRVGKFDPAASEADKIALKRALRSLGSDASGIISKTSEIEFIEAAVKAASSDIYKDIIELANDEMTLAILGQLHSSKGTSGSLGGNEAQDNVRQDIKQGDARAISRAIYGGVIVPLVDWRFGTQKRYPTHKFAYEEAEDLKELAERDQKLVEMGVPMGVGYFRQKYNIPEPGRDEEIVKPWATKGPEGETKEDKTVAAKQVGAFSDKPAADDTVAMIAEGIDDSVFAEAVWQLLEEVGSLEEARDRVIELVESIGIEKLTEQLAAGISAVTLIGLGDEDVS